MTKLPDIIFPTDTHPSHWEFYDWMRVILNNGRYQLRVVESEPNWTAGDGEMVLWNDTVNERKYLYMYIIDGWYGVTFLTKSAGGGTRFHNIGEVFIWAGGDTAQDIPGNTIVCNGAEVSRTTYSELFDVIGTSFGPGDGSTTFNVPDMRGRVPLGKDNMGGTSADRVTDTDADTVGGYGGHQEIQAHSHSGSYMMVATGTDGGIGSGGRKFQAMPSYGGGDSGNLQPFQTLVYLVQA